MRIHLPKTFAVLSVCGFPFLACAINDIEPGKEYYTAIYVPRPIVLDGNLSEWSGVPVLADPKFAVPKFSGTNANPNYVLFEEYDGGVWTGPDDQTSAVQIAYDADNVYFGFVVTDDYHENSARSAWNGDSVQLMIASADRTTQVALYNYALAGIETDPDLNNPTNIIVEHEAGPGGTSAVIRRDTVNKKTYYEIKLPAASLGLTTLKGGPSFGLGMAINDGDAGVGQNGQKGWGGLGAHAIVFGKTPSETALMTLIKGNDIEPGKEYYTALRITNTVTIDGTLNASEWSGVPVLADPKFAVPKYSGTNANPNYVLFEEYDGGVWTGPDDQTSAVQIAYDADNVYFGFVVTDDYHENSARSAWNGDSVQLMIASADRTTQVALYNYALAGIETDPNLNDPANIIVEHEAGPGGTTGAVRRDTVNKKTYYEIQLPAASLGLTAPLTVGTKFGLGMAINDGDAGIGQNGQKGWGGLGAHAIVFGKTPSETALVTLGTSVTGGDVIFLSSINSSYNSFSFRATDKGASIVDPTKAKLTIDGVNCPLTASPKVVDATDFTYHPPSPFPPNSAHNYTIEARDTLGSTVTSQGTFRVDNYNLDKLHSYYAQIRSGSALTPDRGGHTGQAGDTALDFGNGAIVTAGLIPDASFINPTASNDMISVSLWVKKYDNTNNSSAFWIESPSSGTDYRGVQANIPDPTSLEDVINFDVAGNVVDTTRLSATVNTTTVPSFTGPEWWTNAWHHWVFVYSGTNGNFASFNKQIYVDGQLLVEGYGWVSTPTDFTRIWLGAGNGGQGAQGGAVLNMHGLIDDFAIFGTALTAAQAQQLHNGTLPSALTGATPLAYWDFNAVAPSPSLTISRAGTAITISWPASATGFVLQAAPALSGTYTNVLGVVGNSITVNNPSGTLFYRMQK
ncbi:MAG TPA: sugar-binding protein [Verrucomicrobiae bacterium]